MALTNVMACILANILVATRLTYSMARDNMLPFSHVWRHVSPSNRTPTYAVLGIFGFSTILLLLALVSEKAFFLILGLSSLAVFADVPPADHRRDDRHPPRHHPGRRTGHVRPRPGARAGGSWSRPSCFTLVCAALIFLPQFAGNGYVFLGLVVLASALGRHRVAQAAGHRRGRTGLRQDPHSPETR